MNEELLSNSMAAQTLSELIQDKTPEQWAGWLQNNRNQSRTVPYRIPFQRISGGIFYARDELDKFADFEKQRQLGTIKLTGRAAEVLQAFGTGKQGSTANGRRWKGASANLGTNKDGAFVQTVINEPLLVFAMTPDQAIEFGNELTEAGQAAKRINSLAEQKPDLSGYQTVADNADMREMRKGKK